MGNSYLEFNKTIRRDDDVNIDDNSVIRLVNIAIAFCFLKNSLSKTSRGDLEHNNFVGQISTKIKNKASKDEYLLSHFDNINEGEIADSTRNTSSKNMPINNHEAGNKGKIKGQLPLEHIFVFCRTLKKITKNLAFHITFKTANLQYIL